MGRKLFSLREAPALRTEPEHLDGGCHKWSLTNQFDPDSDEFFANAQAEMFIDPDSVRQQTAEEIEEEVRNRVVAGTDDSASSDSSDGSSDAGTPMATGSDDPAVLIAGSTSVYDWQRLEAGAPIVRPRYPIIPITRTRPMRTNIGYNPDDYPFVQTRSPFTPRPRSGSEVPILLPPSHMRSSTLTVDPRADQVPTPPRSPVLSRPIAAPLRSRSRSSSPARLPAVPTTPIPADLLSPSPPASVTPSMPYTWRGLDAAPASPTRYRGAIRESPLTNPRARMSYARLTTTTTAAYSLVQHTN